MCPVNAERINASESFVCICQVGYIHRRGTLFMHRCACSILYISQTVHSPSLINCVHKLLQLEVHIQVIYPFCFS